MYVKDRLLQQALAATTSEWSAILSLVQQCGSVVYNRSTEYALRVGCLVQCPKPHSQAYLNGHKLEISYMLY